MNRRALISVLVLTLTLFAASSYAQTYGAVLTAGQESPPTTSPGFGTFTGTLDSTHTNITISLTVANLGAAISGYHIHEKAAGSPNGNIVINFQGLGGTFVNNKLTGTFPVAADVAARMLANPSNFYVNVHTTQFPGGAIRGDLALTNGGVITHAAELRGSNEVPPNASAAIGSAIVTIDTINNTLAWDVNETGIATPTLSHIHGQAAPGANASVLINFATSASAFTGGRTKGSVPIGTLSPENLNSLFTNPGNFYVNVHSSAFPGGEIRGQLVAANEYDVPIAGRVTNGLGQTFVTDVRIFNPSYDAATTALVEFFAAGTTANVNATQSIPVNIPARGTAVLDDVAGPSGLNITGTGALRVSSAAKLAVTSRIFADLRAAGKGTFGQFVPGSPRASALRRGVLCQTSNRTDLSGGSRTNLGFFNPTIGPVTVRLELRAATGTLLGSNTVTLQALSQQQLSLGSYFPGVDVANLDNASVTFDAAAPVVAYASVVDNVSTDQIFVSAQEDPGVATTP